MASKKKRNRPRPQAGARPAAKPANTAGPASPAGGTAKAGGGTAKAAPRPSKERTGPTRAERLAAAEAARRRKAVRNRVFVIGGMLALVAVIAVTATNARRSDSRAIERLEASGACDYDTQSDSDRGAGNNHITGDVSYEVDPPAGGNHNPAAASSGVYTAETKPADGQIVHALEHGYVTIWYRSSVDAAEVGQLRDLAGRYNRDVLLVPRDTMSVPIAATAWHRRLLCNSPDVDALERFVTEYRNKGPEKVPH